MTFTPGASDMAHPRLQSTCSFAAPSKTSCTRTHTSACHGCTAPASKCAVHAILILPPPTCRQAQHTRTGVHVSSCVLIAHSSAAAAATALHHPALRSDAPRRAYTCCRSANAPERADAAPRMWCTTWCAANEPTFHLKLRPGFHHALPTRWRSMYSCRRAFMPIAAPVSPFSSLLSCCTATFS